MIFTTSAEMPLLFGEMFLSFSALLRFSGFDGAPPIDSILGRGDQNRKRRRTRVCVCVCVGMVRDLCRLLHTDMSVQIRLQYIHGTEVLAHPVCGCRDRKRRPGFLPRCRESFHEGANQSRASVHADVTIIHSDASRELYTMDTGTRRGRGTSGIQTSGIIILETIDLNVTNFLLLE